MANQSLKTGRQIAVEVLNQFDPKRNYAAAILKKLLPHTAEKQRATDLVFSSIRNRMVLDKVIVKVSCQPIERIDARLLNILRIAACEFIYSPETPQYSIVNEAAENAKAIGGKRQVGFVNGVLRQITRHIVNRQSNLTETNRKNTVPQTATTGCEFDPRKVDLLPDYRTSPADYLSAAFSLPKWLVTDWLGEFGTELTHQICIASNRRPSIYIRPNRLKTTAQELAEHLHQADVDLEIISDTGSQSKEPGSFIRIKSPQAVTKLPGFAEGLFTVQDITSSQAIRILDPQPDWKILDLCAAPGVKTTQLAELTGDAARIVATDTSSWRLQKLKANTTRLGINSITIVEYENLEGKVDEFGPFDVVLLDVPCSNTGVLAKRIEVRHRITPRAIKQLAKTQSQLLSAAIRPGRIKPTGKICYSTCSIQGDENSRLAGDFLLHNHNFGLEFEELTLPSAEKPDHDGGYIAIIARE